MQYSTSQNFSSIKDEVIHLVRYSNNITINEMLWALKRINEDKKQIDIYLDLMNLWYRDILMFKATRNINRVLFREAREDIIRLSEIISFEKLSNIQEAFSKVKIRLNANVNFDITMELLLLTLFE